METASGAVSRLQANDQKDSQSEGRHDLAGRDFAKILLIKLSAVGDVVHAIPLLNKLRQRYPQARIDWLATPAVAELLANNPAISNVIEFVRDEWSKPWQLAPYASAARLIAQLRAVRYDLVLDLQGQLRSGVFAFGCGAPMRIGFDRPRASRWQALQRKIPDEARRHAWQGAREGSFLAYTHHVDLPTLDIHPVDRYLRFGALLGLDTKSADFTFPIPAEATNRIDALLDYYEIAKSPLVVMAPGTNWQTKQWRSDAFADVARHFLGKKFAVTLIGSGGEHELCAEVAKLAPGAINLAGETTLTELAALIRRGTICVSNDSGPMHMAVALDRPVIAVFGPTDPVWAGPYRRDNAVLRADLACSPCYLRLLARCPNNHDCMKNVSVSAVIERAEKIIAALPPSRPKAALKPAPKPAPGPAPKPAPKPAPGRS
ncbi:MAG TPA: lipopolysaccharide heptosyltransferase II [Xanthobacteraceae bacterium]|nr:lipopolysaccharide heptosyltransferase II [Xanthobacteraceae bacterium]